jgi:hypothetical protein
MNQREKFLVGAVGLLVILWGGTVGWGRYQAALTSNQNQQSSAEQQLSEAHTASERGLQAQRMLRGWRRQSLPTNLDIAKSLYQDWLRKQLIEAGLTVRELTESTSRSAQKHFSQVTFVVNAQGTLDELTEFLYRFYQSDHLHRISAATLTPTTTRRALTVSLTIDALSLPDSPRSDQLAEGSSDLFSESLDEIRQEIVSRNVFVAYGVAEPSEQQVAESPDEAAKAFITSLTEGEGGWQMAVRMSDSGKVSYFRVGDEIQIGRFTGRVEAIDGRRVIVSQEEKRVQIFGGKNLGQAVVLSEEAG